LEDPSTQSRYPQTFSIYKDILRTEKHRTHEAKHGTVISVSVANALWEGYIPNDWHDVGDMCMFFDLCEFGKRVADLSTLLSKDCVIEDREKTNPLTGELEKLDRSPPGTQGSRKQMCNMFLQLYVIATSQLVKIWSTRMESEQLIYAVSVFYNLVNGPRTKGVLLD
jgi:hypothetical protein